MESNNKSNINNNNSNQSKNNQKKNNKSNNKQFYQNYKNKKSQDKSENDNNIGNKNRIKIEDLHNLDEFIQSCLNKFKFVEPFQSLYDSTGNDQDSIISHKSTIPDLVIWNKTFNKNECYEGADLEQNNDFPRYRFYLRLNKEKDNKGKNKDKEKKE